MRRWAEHNVVATFSDMDQAREAIEALGRQGVEADHISLLGHDAQEASSDPDTRLRDLDVSGELAKSAGTAAAAGAVAGGLIGAAAFVIPGVGPVIGAGVWAAVAGGAIGGSSVGAMVGGVSSLDLSEEWELTFQDSVRAGRALVAVHATDDGELDEATKALKNLGPEKVDRVDSDGHVLDVDG